MKGRQFGKRGVGVGGGSGTPSPRGGGCPLPSVPQEKNPRGVVDTPTTRGVWTPFHPNLRDGVGDGGPPAARL